MKIEGLLFTGAIVTLGGLAGAGRPAVCPLPSTVAVAYAAAQAMPQVAPVAKPVEELVRDIKSPDADTRRAALRALAASGFPEAIAPMATLLTDERDDIQLEAMSHLLGYYIAEGPKGSKRVALVFEVRKARDAEAVFDLGPFVLVPRPVPVELTDGLAGAIRDDNDYVRLQAVYALGVMARPPLEGPAADALVAALGDKERRVRLAAARVAGALRASSAAPALVAAINDKDREVRYAAMRSLGDLKDVTAVQALTDQLNYYKKGLGAETAIDALARIGYPGSIPVFQQRLTDRNWVIRRHAAEGLARAGDPLAALVVEPVLQSEKQESVRLAMVYALARAGRPSTGGIIDALGGDELASQAMVYLVEMGDSAVPALTQAMRNQDVVVRERTAMVLGLIGSPPAIGALETVPQDPDVRVQRAVERAIARARMPAR